MKLSQLSADNTAPRPERPTAAAKDDASFDHINPGFRSMAKTRNTTDDAIQSPGRMGNSSVSKLPKDVTRRGPSRGGRLSTLSDG